MFLVLRLAGESAFVYRRHPAGAWAERPGKRRQFRLGGPLPGAMASVSVKKLEVLRPWAEHCHPLPCPSKLLESLFSGVERRIVPPHRHANFQWICLFEKSDLTTLKRLSAF